MGSRLVCRLGWLAAIPLCMVVAGDSTAVQDTPTKVEVIGTAFRLTMPDGRVLTGADLVGAVLMLGRRGRGAAQGADRWAAASTRGTRQAK